LKPIMSLKRKAEPAEESPKKAKKDSESTDSDLKESKSGNDEAWLDRILGKQEFEELAKKEPKEFKDDKQSFKEYEALFAQIAQRLLQEVIVMINGKGHRFIEIEFYYKSGNHPDNFTHGHPVQKKFAKWYFHRTGHSMSAYKSGTYKGMDISIGGHTEHPDSKAKEKTIHGGILIRGIQPLEKGEAKGKKGKLKENFIEGPSTVVDYILKQCGSTSIESFISTNFAGQENAPSCIGSKKFYLTSRNKAQELKKLNVYASPRVGLSLKRGFEFGDRLLLSSYRFHSLPGSMSKGKHHMILSLHQQGKSTVEIHTITATSKATIDKYIDHFKKGAKSGKKLKEFGAGKKSFSTEEFAGLYGAWNALYGAL